MRSTGGIFVNPAIFHYPTHPKKPEIEVTNAVSHWSPVKAA